MKKMLVVMAAVAMAFAAQAANLDWKYQGTSAQNGQVVYMLLGSTAQDSWDSVAALEAASADHGTIAKSGMSYVTSGTVIDPALTKTSADYYYVLVNGDSFQVSAVQNGAGSVYDPAAMETTPGALTVKNANAGWGEAKSFGGGGGDVPEPTSGLLLLVGGAMLALRRKQK